MKIFGSVHVLLTSAKHQTLALLYVRIPIWFKRRVV